LGRLGDLTAGLMMLVLSGLGWLYAAKVPNLDPLTIWPFGLWAALFGILGLLFAPLLRKRRMILVVGYAVLVGLLLSEEPLYLLRPLWHDPQAEMAAARERGDLFRVVSLNCGGGDGQAVVDALEHDPDILLLQETPGGFLLERVLPPGWEYAGWLDPAVAVKGRVEAEELPRWLAHQLYVVRAIPDRLGRPVAALSTRFVHPSLQLDIWSPRTWRDARRIADDRVDAMRLVVEQRGRYGSELPAIVGGDFNTPAGNWLLEPLAANGLTDAFRAVGVGWPNTIASDFAFERIDFIYVSEAIKPLRASTAVTEHSDHRMVVVDMALSR
jgi:hypothetical protein